MHCRDRRSAEHSSFRRILYCPIHREAPIESTVLTVHAATGLLDSSEVGRLTEAFVVHEKWSRMVNCVKPLVEIGCIVAELNPIAKMILSVIALGINQFDERLKRLEAIHDLLDTIADASQRVYAQDEPHYRSKRQMQLKTRDILLREIHDALVYLRPLSAVSAARRTSSQVESRIHEFKTRISTFMDDFESKGSVDTQVAVFTILEEMRLDKLPYARGVRAEPSKRCLPGTRVELLQKIRDWALSPVANRVFLLQGTAGRGKTAVAHTVALSLQEAGFVAPFFAFNRYDQERAAHQLLPTLARQLAERNKLYSQYLCDQPSSQLESRDPATQVQCLIRGGLGDCTVGTPIVFVIDALDECSDARLQAEDRRSMLQCLRDCLVDSQLPSNVRFFLTYRPDEDILECLAQPSMQATRLSIDKVNDTDCDIRAFVESKLAGTHFSGQVDEVARAAQTLFQSAAVLCLELTKVNSPRTVVFPRELMRRIMDNPGQPLYETYRAILEAHFDTTSAAVIAILRQLLGWVFVMQSPQPYAVFRSIAKVHLANVDDLDFVFLGLGSLLTGVTPASADPVQPLHTSFRDFILDTTQSQPFSLSYDLAVAHAEVAYGCLRIMNDPTEGLRLNICRLPKTFVLKQHIQDLQQRVSNYISPALRYACQQIGIHLSSGAIQSSGLRFDHESTILLKRNFLFWLETCSCMALKDISAKFLKHFLEWAQRSDRTDLRDFILDCIEFDQCFTEAIAKSPPQVYISGLTLAPRNSRVGKLYRSRFNVPVHISGNATSHGWPVDTSLHIARTSFRGESPSGSPAVKTQLAHSPDGGTVALGVYNKGACFWYDKEGMRNGLYPMGWPRIAMVIGVTFAPDGKLFACSLTDGTIE
ncbi:uncharacterized protein SCHCODRAFT_02298765 [Schizophyllum commune H4-8]|uniref:uncharacterized protein n=1 Tax=Schizophyllum commune (strain H4-8 / FGSC 9210) TaxID=578458 RepID=UPI00215FE3A1|nr:uncharacterized protein SCHCODRAFT_02298765 [Schizophyllum commune H4-8]KAI5892695.1 hypothetical protein SCHCODRAFT_02298765 [Schizophyllum commune H4-8]